MTRAAARRRPLPLLGLALACLALAGLASHLRPRELTLPSAHGAEKKPTAKYVSVKLCRMCHTVKSTGNQYGQWKKTKHALAFKTLATPKAKEVAAKLGIKDPQKDSKCLKCHVTGALTPRLSTKILAKDGVQCESCHGAGQFYAKLDVFRQGREAAIAKGLVVPNKKLCVKCHNKESPTFPGTFDFDAMWKKVLHPLPSRKK